MARFAFKDLTCPVLWFYYVLLIAGNRLAVSQTLPFPDQGLLCDNHLVSGFNPSHEEIKTDLLRLITSISCKMDYKWLVKPPANDLSSGNLKMSLEIAVKKYSSKRPQTVWGEWEDNQCWRRWWWWWWWWWWCWGWWCWGGGPIPRPRTTLCASLHNRNARQHFTRATLYRNLQGKMPWPRTAAHTLCEPVQSKCTSTFHESFIRKFTEKIPRPRAAVHTLREPAQSKCTSTFHKSHGHFKRKFTGKRPAGAPWSSPGLCNYRKNPSVWTHCLGNYIYI